MKKLSLFLIVIFITFITYGQTPLYKGLTSGMTEKEVLTCVKSDPRSFTLIPDKVSVDETITTVIKNRTYLVNTSFNKDGKLASILFLCLDEYDWAEYNINIRENATELFSLLSVKYGEPIYNKFCNWNDVPKGKFKFICYFKKGTIDVGIFVVNNDNTDKYYVGLIIKDEKFDNNYEQSSEGF